MNPFPYDKHAATAKEMQANANHHWFEQMACVELAREAEDYLSTFKGDTVATDAARGAARDAHAAVRHHQAQHRFWTKRAQQARAS